MAVDKEALKDTIKEVLREAVKEAPEAFKPFVEGKAKEGEGEGVESLPKEERFKKFIHAVLAKDEALVKDLGGNVDAEGGYLIPTEFRAELIKGLETVGVMRKVVRVVPVGNRTGDVPKLTSRPAYAFGTENQDFTQSSMQFGQVTWSLKRLEVFIPVSRELISDSAINIYRLITDEFTHAYAKAEDDIMSNGSGSVKGVLNDTNVPETDVGTNGLSYNSLVEVFYSLEPAYRENAVWMVSNHAMKVLMELKDNQDRPLIMNPVTGQPPTLFGKPIVENPRFQDTTDANGDTVGWIVVGDFKSACYLFDIGEFAIDSTAEGEAFRKHQVWFKSWNRIDFKIALPEGLRRIKNVK